ncbi:MAG: pirin family protein [Streptomycetaceae bacterium]|nr:pirin family protein [Streptomycetaceae bacterium]
MTSHDTAFDVRPAADRFHTAEGWLDSWHSFSFSRHYDPANTHFGLLLVSNDDTVSAGTGFGTHPHRDMEIVTWVLSGALVHQDSEGNSGVIHPGLAQRMSAGSGILHSEKNDPQASDVAGPVHFVQMWVLPDEAGIAPGYQQLDVSADLDRGGLVTIASGRGTSDAAIRIHQKDAALHAARLTAGQAIVLPTAPYAHVFVARGTVTLEGAGTLAEGDAVRITGAAGQRITAADDAEILIWEMHTALRAD